MAENESLLTRAASLEVRLLRHHGLQLARVGIEGSRWVLLRDREIVGRVSGGEELDALARWCERGRC